MRIPTRPFLLALLCLCGLTAAQAGVQITNTSSTPWTIRLSLSAFEPPIQFQREGHLELEVPGGEMGVMERIAVTAAPSHAMGAQFTLAPGFSLEVTLREDTPDIVVANLVDGDNRSEGLLLITRQAEGGERVEVVPNFREEETIHAVVQASSDQAVTIVGNRFLSSPGRLPHGAPFLQ
jgi:hypothetical protein